VPFPEDKLRIDVGSVACDFSALRAATGWVPTTSLAAGIEGTVAYYRDRLHEYV
jgi:nucleoside-diphosphate-sugar epimerase